MSRRRKRPVWHGADDDWNLSQSEGWIWDGQGLKKEERRKKMGK